MKPMTTDIVRFPLNDPDMTPSHIRDLHVSQTMKGNDACTGSADSEDGRPAGCRSRSHPARRRTPEYLTLSGGFSMDPAG